MEPLPHGKEHDLSAIDWSRTTAQERLSYGSLVKNLRLARGYKQEDLSAMSGVSRKTIGNIESQKTAGQPLIMERLFRHLGVTGPAPLDSDVQNYLTIIGPLIAAIPGPLRKQVLTRVVEILVEAISGQESAGAKNHSQEKLDIKRIGRLMG